MQLEEIQVVGAQATQACLDSLANISGREVLRDLATHDGRQLFCLQAKQPN